MRREMMTGRATRVVVIATALLLGTTAAASARVETYHRSGFWDNYAGTNNDGDTVCGMSTSGGDNGEFRMLHIKYYRNTDAVRVEVFKDSWRIPRGTSISIEVGFDNSQFGSIDSAAGTTNKLGGMISFGIARDSQSSFFELFGAAKQMWLRFPAGNEKPWFATMTGSRDAVNLFLACMVKVSKTRPTQPFGAAPPSQPFGNGETQPSRQPQQPQLPSNGI